MARINNLSNFLSDVADSIRRKKKTENTITPANFDAEIDSIPTGTAKTQTKSINIIENGTSTVLPDENYDALDEVDITVNVPIPAPNLQNKNVNIVENGNTEVEAEDGYDGLNKVNINVNVPSEEPNLQSKDITIIANGTTKVEPDANYDGLSDVDITVNVPQPSGTINIVENGTVDVTNYASASVQVPNSPDWTEIGYEDTPQTIIDGFNYAKQVQANWNPNATSLNGKFNKDTNLLVLPLVDTSKVTNFSDFCRDARHLIYIPLIDTSKATTLQSAFAGVAIIDFPALDTSSCTNFSSAFGNNKSLKHFRTIDTSKGKDFSYMFRDCEQLQDIEVLDLSSATNLQNMFQNCNQLTDYSLNNIIAMCIGATSYTGTKTLRQLGLNSSRANRATQLENYQAFLDAGWTTGY
jgi:hypothetical protein